MARAKKAERSYEYFKSEGFELKGKYRDYVDALWTQGKVTENSRFRRLLDIYSAGVLVGLKIGKRAEDDSSGEKRTIQLEQIANEHVKFKTLMQIVLLVDESRGLSEEERFHIAFDETPMTEQQYRENMNLFNSYARAGIEYMYNVLVLRSTTVDDEFSDFHVANMMALLDYLEDDLI